MPQELDTFQALIVDDDELIRNLMVDALSTDDTAHWVITTAESSEQAWDRLKIGQKFDVASIDIRLSGRSGVGLIQDMRQERVDIPVVVVSGTVDTHAILKCLEMGAADYVIKPFEIKSYRNAMRRAAELAKEGVEFWTPVDLATPMADWVEITTSSQKEFLIRLRQFSKALLRNLRSPRTAKDVRLALEELTHNAIEWGNRYETSKKVRIAYAFFHDRMVVKIEDEGEGFVPNDIEDPRKDPIEHIQKRRDEGKRPGGYGIHLVRAVMDEVMYNRKGNVVLFTKYIH